MNNHSEFSTGGYFSHNTIRLVRGGLQYFDLLEDLIDRAKESIHLQVYIYDDDETGNRITRALIRAAHRGVKIFILLDGYASKDLSKESIQAITRAGIHFRWFVPLVRGRNFYIGRRMHHKVFVADGVFSLVGGINISNHYNDMPEKPAWLDWAVYVQGEISGELYNRCMQMWFRGRKHGQLSSVRTVVDTDRNCFIRVRINDWVRNKNQISRSYLEMFHRAQTQITMMSSYFLPGRIFRKNIRMAATRGVRIRIVLTKISDVTIAKLAERFFYPWLLRLGIELYEYRRKVVHGKIATYDGHWVTVGSYNVNNISAYASIELNLDIHNKSFGQLVNQTLDEIIVRDCDRITTEDFNRKSTFVARIINRMAYDVFRMLFFLFTFYFKQQKS